MTTLDTLARSAAAAVHESVADLAVSAAPAGAAAAAGAAWRMARYAAVGAAAGAAVVAALIVATPDEETVTNETIVTTTVAVPSTTTTPVTTTMPAVTTTVPTPTGELPVVPGVGAPTSTTTTTTTTTVPDTTPPVLKINSPSNGEAFETEVVTFAGITEPGAKVTASGRYPASVSSDGSWVIDLVLAPGSNGVVFTAADAAGNTSQARLTVYLDVPKETTTTTKAEKGWEFSAFQKYGTCSEPIPYDEFWGTGKPGSTINVASSYGSGTTTVSEDGTYWLRVEFPEAPHETSFTVKVRDELGNKKVFEFVSNYGA